MSQFCQCQRLDATCLLKVTFTSHPSPSSPNTDHSAGTTRVACRPTQWGCLCGNNMDWFLEWSELSRDSAETSSSLCSQLPQAQFCVLGSVSPHTPMLDHDLVTGGHCQIQNCWQPPPESYGPFTHFLHNRKCMEMGEKSMQICLEQSKQERSPASGLKESQTFRDSSHVQFQNVQVPQVLQVPHCRFHIVQIYKWIYTF